MKLNLGCGSDFRKGWLNVDSRRLYSENAEFLCCDLVELDGHVEDESVEEIVAQDVLEFLPWRHVDGVLVTLWKKLRPGGVLYVRVPDLELLVLPYVRKQISHEDMQRAVCGDQGYPQETVRSVWSVEKLAGSLRMVGLTVERIDRSGSRISAWGRRMA